MQEKLHLREMKIGVIINTSSGGCDVSSEVHMQKLLIDAHIVSPRMWCTGSEGLPRALEEMSSEAFDAVIVLGGDGTIRSIAQMTSEKGPALLPLPGGTMNVLPRALYGTSSWEEALQLVLQNPSLCKLSGGKVGDKKFYISAVVGAPALWAEARESRGGST